jgi:predicted anti-sigma-YlaC factor YlaD
MDCKTVEVNLSRFIENDLSDREQQAITNHLKMCERCRKLKAKVEYILYIYPELEEEIPFFLKNRLYNIVDPEKETEIKDGYIRWVAAVVGTVVLFMNLFYFTNIYPSANRVLHLAVAEFQKFVVETGAFFEKIKESRNNFLFGFGTAGRDVQKNLESKENSNVKGGENG